MLECSGRLFKLILSILWRYSAKSKLSLLKQIYPNIRFPEAQQAELCDTELTQADDVDQNGHIATMAFKPG